MAIKREGFFGTDNLHRAGWTVVVALAGFVGALIYQKVFGPQKVVVEAMPPTSSPVQVTTELSPRSKEIADLSQAIKKLAEATTSSAERKRVTELSVEVDRLQAEVTQSRKQLSLPSQLVGDGSLAAAVTSTVAAKITSAKFSLPENINGYTSAKLFGVLASSCPPSVIASGMAVVATFDLADSSLRSRATPLRATIDKVRTPTDLLQIDEVWYELQDGKNTVSFIPRLDPGSYRFTYGFYLRTNLSGKFPPFYSRECTFVVPKS